MLIKNHFNTNLYKKILSSFYGTVLVADKNRKIFYVTENTLNLFNINSDEIIGKTVDEMVENGYFKNSATLDAYRTKKLTIKYVEGRIKTPILTVSTPILDENGEIEMVTAFSLNEPFLIDIVKEMESEKNRALQLANYFTYSNSKNTLFICESSAMKKIYSYLKKVSPSDCIILLTGASGTGKEVLSRFIHQNSNRKDSIFIPINCAAIPNELIESELFGYVKGAFTGANNSGKAGLFELAHNGTLFLDEVGEMPLSLQSKLLRVLETGEFYRLGSDKKIQTDVRIIAATNRNLKEMVTQGKFREDLYYRLNVIPLEIPPIRERKEDIIPLAKFFLNQYNIKYNYSKIFLSSTLKEMEKYNWPGNVREIKNAVERMVISSSSDILEFNYFNNSKVEEPLYVEIKKKEVALDFTEEKPLKEVITEYEKQYIYNAISECNGNILQAAERLKIHRSALYRKLDKYKHKS